MQLLRHEIRRLAFALAIPWIALTSSPWAQTLTEQAKLFASDAAVLDYFGSSVAIFEDTAVVGAGLDDHAGGTDAGSAYVFVRNGTSWAEQAKLVASDAAATEIFGWSVGISGNTAVVGALLDDYAGGTYTESGSAYVFVRNGTSWTEEAKLVASGGTNSDGFGSVVSISGDTVVVGAYLDDTAVAGVNRNDARGTDAGSAYVFVRSGTSWTEQAKLVASDAAAFDYFGYSVSISGDTAVVGAVSDTLAGGTMAGSAFVFVRNGTSWTEQARLVASDAADGDVFGGSVSISGDTAVVGANLEDNAGGPEAGSAYVFVRNGTTWTEQAKLVASDAAADDQFGISISVSGNTALVGAIYDDHAGGSYAGSAYAFIRNGTSWTEQAKLVASDAAGCDHFGNRVAISGEWAVVCAIRGSGAGVPVAGLAYVYCLTEASTTFRNAGSNPASYTASAPVLGGTFTGTVDLSTTGHPLAILFGFDSPSQFTFPAGQVLLCLDLGGSGELLGTPAAVGPTAVFNLAVPNDLTLAGLSIFTQALHVGFVKPIALSNAQDLVLGTF